MPAEQLPDDRRLVDQLSRSIDGIDANIYVYREEYHRRLLPDYTARHVRVELHMQQYDIERTAYVHSRAFGRNRALLPSTPLPDAETQVEETIEKAERRLQKLRELREGIQ